MPTDGQNNQPGVTPPGNDQNPTTPQTPTNETFESFMEQQSDQVRALYTAHTAGLKSALDSERAARNAAEKQLRELAKKAQEGSELQAALTRQADDLAALQQRSEFYDLAHKAGVRNLGLAYIAAGQAGLLDSKGNCDFVKLRNQFPELFITPPPGNAGNGTNNPGTAMTMNQAIRRAAGRG